MVNIITCTSATIIAPLRLSPALDMFRTPEKQHAALLDIADDDNCCVTIAQDNQQIIAYASFHPPTEVETWGDDTTGKLIELGAVEVDPSYRGQRLAQRVLEASLAQGRYDDTVIFATMYVWHYDTKRTGLSQFQYKRMLEHLYKNIGMQPYRTSDPEIRADPANQLMARIGANCDPAIETEFHRLRSQDLLNFSALM